MTYATQAAYEAAYGADELLQLTDRTGTGEADAAVYAAAAAQADAEVDGYLAGRFTLPLSAVDPEIVRLALIITRQRLYISGRPDHVQKDYDHAMARLADIRDGRFQIGAEPVGLGGSLNEVFFGSDERQFGRGVL